MNSSQLRERSALPSVSSRADCSVNPPRATRTLGPFWIPYFAIDILLDRLNTVLYAVDTSLFTLLASKLPEPPVQPATPRPSTRRRSCARRGHLGHGRGAREHHRNLRRVGFASHRPSPLLLGDGHGLQAPVQCVAQEPVQHHGLSGQSRPRFISLQPSAQDQRQHGPGSSLLRIRPLIWSASSSPPRPRLRTRHKSPTSSGPLRSRQGNPACCVCPPGRA